MLYKLSQAKLFQKFKNSKDKEYKTPEIAKAIICQLSLQLEAWSIIAAIKEFVHQTN